MYFQLIYLTDIQLISIYFQMISIYFQDSPEQYQIKRQCQNGESLHMIWDSEDSRWKLSKLQ